MPATSARTPPKAPATSSTSTPSTPLGSISGGRQRNMCTAAAADTSGTAHLSSWSTTACTEASTQDRQEALLYELSARAAVCLCSVSSLNRHSCRTDCVPAKELALAHERALSEHSRAQSLHACARCPGRCCIRYHPVLRLCHRGLWRLAFTLHMKLSTCCACSRDDTHKSADPLPAAPGQHPQSVHMREHAHAGTCMQKCSPSGRSSTCSLGAL